MEPSDPLDFLPLAAPDSGVHGTWIASWTLGVGITSDSFHSEESNY
jgi:hypothetical protein